MVQHLYELAHTVNARGSASEINKDTSTVNGLCSLLKDNRIQVPR